MDFYGINQEILTKHLKFIKDRLNKDGVIKVLKREYKLSDIKACKDKDNINLTIIGSGLTLYLIKKELKYYNKRRNENIESRENSDTPKSFFYESIECALRKLNFYEFEISSMETKYLRCFDIERAKSIIEDKYNIKIIEESKSDVTSSSGFNSIIWELLMNKLNMKIEYKYDENDINYQFNLENRKATWVFKQRIYDPYENERYIPHKQKFKVTLSEDLHEYYKADQDEENKETPCYTAYLDIKDSNKENELKDSIEEDIKRL